jgi:hypothetical protein
MRRLFVLLVLVLGYSAVSVAQEAEALHLVKRVSVPGVQRKWDHFGVDLPGNRLFASSEEEPVIEVFDLQSGKHLRTLTDFKETHNALPLPELTKIFVVDGGASEIPVLDYTSYKVIVGSGCWKSPLTPSDTSNRFARSGTTRISQRNKAGI